MRFVMVICLAVLTSTCLAADEKLFVGVFESETRENFGSSTPGEYRIEVIAIAMDKYAATIYHRGKVLVKQELVDCSEERKNHLSGRAPGRVEVLCSTQDFPVLTYVENGLTVRAVKPKYAKNPQLAKQEGLEPGDPNIFELRHHKTKYYAQVQWFLYGFRKVGS